MTELFLLWIGLAIAGIAYAVGYLSGSARRKVLDATKTKASTKVTWLPSEHREESLRRAIETGVARAVYRHQHRYNP